MTDIFTLLKTIVLQLKTEKKNFSTVLKLLILLKKKKNTTMTNIGQFIPNLFGYIS